MQGEAQGGGEVSQQPSPAWWHGRPPPAMPWLILPFPWPWCTHGCSQHFWVPGADGICPQVAGEQKYHPECFSCLNCRTFIGDGDTYALVERSKLYWYVPAWLGGWGGGGHTSPWHPLTRPPPPGPAAGTAITRWW